MNRRKGVAFNCSCAFVHFAKARQQQGAAEQSFWRVWLILVVNDVEHWMLSIVRGI